jgi:hypothetical protein
MPKRPKEHQFETESRRAFELSLPASWVYRDINPDYGVDGIVEIFSRNGRATGLLFLVQLKSSGDISARAPFRIYLKMHSYVYYKTLVLPVLLVVFHKSTNRLFAKWIPDIPKHSLSGKNVAILLKQTDTWNSRRFPHIRRVLRNLKQNASFGQRDSRIKQYYAHKVSINLGARAHGHVRRTNSFSKDDRVFHPVFGYGNVDCVSDYLMFVHFDEDDLLRKFVPGAFPEFTVVEINQPRNGGLTRYCVESQEN